MGRLTKYLTFLLFLIACDPKLMPSFPQHRNLKTTANSKGGTAAEPAANTGAGDQTNNLPAISDLVSYSSEGNYRLNLIIVFLF